MKNSPSVRSDSALAMPSAASSPAGASQGSGGAAGKSSRTAPSGWRAARKTPPRVWNTASASGPSRSVSYSTCALASVAWPHRSTSTAGVNHRRPNDPSARGSRYAVSECRISAAMLCIHAPSGASPGSSGTTPAWLPRNVP
jgi:hypothetical protein